MRHFVFFILFLILPFYSHSQDKRTIDSLSAIAHKTIPDTSSARAYCLLCWEYKDIDTVECRKSAETGIQLADKLNFLSAKAQCITNLAQMYVDQADYLRAINYFMTALELRRKTGEVYKEGNVLRNIGINYTSLNKYDKALQYYLQSLACYEKIKDKKGIYNTLCAIGESYYLDGNLNQSTAYLEDALNISLVMNDSAYIANSYMNLGLLYGENHQSSKAMYYLKKGLVLNERLGQKENTEASYLNLGLIYAREGKQDEALECYQKCLVLAKELDIKDDMGIALSNISQVYIVKKDYISAIKYGEQSMAIAKEINQKDKIKDVAENLAEANAGLNNYEKAYEFERMNSFMKDSLYSDERQKTITEMQTKYDVDKKEKENEFLNQQVTLQNLDAKQQRTITYSIGVVAVLVCLLAFYVFRGYRQKQRANNLLEEQNSLIEQQKYLVEEKNKDITDSITYAKRIQTAILPSDEMIRKISPSSFVLYKPKDIVSGDFYWFAEKDNYYLFAVADCTGHGVPGAFMSMIGNDLLTQIVIEKGIIQPNLILTQLHEGVKNALKQDADGTESKDGMDIAVIAIDKRTLTDIEFAGALRPLWIIEKGSEELKELKGDKHSIGGSYIADENTFVNYKLKLNKGDLIYLFSDGYADQFGGEHGKKFMTRNMKQLLFANRESPMNAQKQILLDKLSLWQENRQQVDDILVTGFQL